MAENGRKILGGEDYVTGARRQEFEAAERSWIWLGILGSLQ